MEIPTTTRGRIKCTIRFSRIARAFNREEATEPDAVPFRRSRSLTRPISRLKGRHFIGVSWFTG